MKPNILGVSLLIFVFGLGSVARASAICTDSDIAHLESARGYSAVAEYIGALDEISRLSAPCAQLRENKVFEAALWGGWCGLRQATLFSGLARYVNHGERLMPFLSKRYWQPPWMGGPSCERGQKIISDLGPSGARTAEENALMVGLSFTAISNALMYYGDTNLDGKIDWSIGSGNRPCGKGGGGIDSETANYLIVSLANGIEAIRTLNHSSDLNSLNLFFANFCAISDIHVPGFCHLKDPAAITSYGRRLFRAYLEEGVWMGLGINTLDVATIAGTCEAE